MHLKILSYDIPSLPRHFSISGIWGHFRYFSLWVLPHWYLMNWCAADVTDGDKKEREIELVWQHCGVNITLFFFLYFSIPPPHCLHLMLSLCTTFSSSSPPSLTFTLSSLQEVLELAFSVLYESDEYLNFIAPDKHEVSRWWSSTESDRMIMCDRTKRKVILQCGVCASVRYVLETVAVACLRGSFETGSGTNKEKMRSRCSRQLWCLTRAVDF